MTISEAVERYLNERKANVSESTLYNHSSQLKQFIEWCKSDDERPGTISDIDSWAVADFRVHRRDEHDLEPVTLYNQMTIIRVFIKWCEQRGLLSGVSDGIMIPTVEDSTSDENFDPDRASTILEQLGTYDYATMRHVLFGILWTAGMRISAAGALDVQDYYSDDNYVELVHRPDSGTPLKNKTGSERHVNLHKWLCRVIDDYLDAHRHDVTDDYGREPLLTTSHGRPHRTTLRKQVRLLTRPCEYASECPFDRSIGTCEATKYNNAAQCPGSVPPHALRRASITHYLNEGHAKELISDRMDLSVDVLEQHYDARSESEKRELRREMFEIE